MDQLTDFQVNFSTKNGMAAAPSIFGKGMLQSNVVTMAKTKALRLWDCYTFSIVFPQFGTVFHYSQSGKLFACNRI